jgi:dihydroneopterin aldolase
MDKIFIHALKAEAIIGIYDWERQVKQTVLIDIELSADIRKAALTDSIDDTLNYKRVAKRVLAFVEGSQFHLVETLAEHVPCWCSRSSASPGWHHLEQTRRGAQLEGRGRLARARSQPSRTLAHAARARLRFGRAGRIILDRPLSWRQVGAIAEGAASPCRPRRKAGSRRRGAWWNRSPPGISRPTA